MKTRKLLSAGKLVALFLLSTLLFSSCKKDDVSPSPAYVGTWIADGAILLVQGLNTTVPPAVSVREKMVIGENDFSSIAESGVANTWIAMGGYRGSLSVLGDVLTMTAKQDGVVNNAGVLVYTDIPSAEQFSMKSKWSVSGDKLTLISDENYDGDFNDVATGDDSSTIYTKN